MKRIILKSPFRWVGGKKNLAPEIAKIYKEFEKYTLVEPFVGGGSIFLHLNPQIAKVNDLNPHLISSYLWLRQGGNRQIETPRTVTEYYHLRSQFNELNQDRIWQGEAFWLLNRLGFNGLCRFNQQGKYNVPAGYKGKNKDFLTLPDIDLSRYQEVLQRVELFELGFEAFLAQIKEGNHFIYADPPYAATYTRYTGQEFSFDDQKRLARILIKSSNPVLISNAHHLEIIDLYQSLGFRIKVLDYVRNNAVNCKGDGRSKVNEIVASNF
jgi:DNA adenine methylase